jgi:hypothetical protein
MPTQTAPDIATSYAVALMPGQAGEVLAVRVLVVDLFGAPSLAEAIGAAVREVDENGVVTCRPWSFLPVQRLVAAREDPATGRRFIPARELAEKRDAYALRLAAGPAAAAAWPVRRKPRLVDAEAPQGRSWLNDHERQQEEAAA